MEIELHLWLALHAVDPGREVLDCGRGMQWSCRFSDVASLPVASYRLRARSKAVDHCVLDRSPRRWRELTSIQNFPTGTEANRRKGYSIRPPYRLRRSHLFIEPPDGQSQFRQERPAKPIRKRCSPGERRRLACCGPRPRGPHVAHPSKPNHLVDSRTLRQPAWAPAAAPEAGALPGTNCFVPATNAPMELGSCASWFYKQGGPTDRINLRGPRLHS